MADRTEDRTYRSLISLKPYDGTDANDIHAWVVGFQAKAINLAASEDVQEAALRVLVTDDAAPVLAQARADLHDATPRRGVQAIPLWFPSDAHTFLMRLEDSQRLAVDLPEIPKDADGNVLNSFESAPSLLYTYITLLLSTFGVPQARRRRKAFDQLCELRPGSREPLRAFVRRAIRTWEEKSLHTPGLQESYIATRVLFSLKPSILAEAKALCRTSLGCDPEDITFAHLRSLASELAFDETDVGSSSVNAVVIPEPRSKTSLEAILERLSKIESQLAKGHTERSPGRGSKNKKKKGSAPFCYICGSEAATPHWTNKCSLRKTRPYSDRGEVLNVATPRNELLFTTVDLGAGGPCRALFDPGSSVTLVSPEVAALAGALPLHGNSVSLSGAFGGVAHGIRTSAFPIHFPTGMEPLSFTISPLVSDIGHDILIGLDYLEKWGWKGGSKNGSRRFYLQDTEIKLNDEGPAIPEARDVFHLDADPGPTWGDIALSTSGAPIRDSVLGTLSAAPDLVATGDVPKATPLLQNDIILKPDARPKVIKPYRMPPAQKAKLKEYVDKLEAGGVLSRLDNAAWGSPLFLVRKPGLDAEGRTRWRVVADWSYVNSQTAPLDDVTPIVRDIFDALGNKTVFSRLDLKSGYWIIPNTPAAACTCAVSTPWGIYAFQRCGMGLRDSGHTLKRLLELALGDSVDDFVFVYADDLVVASHSVADHINHVREVLDRLAKATIQINLDKCLFGTSTFECLGHVIKPGLITVQEAKVNKLLGLRTPANRSDLRTAFGLFSYYRAFLPDFASRTPAIHSLLSPSTKFEWTETAEAEYRQTLATLASTPVLRLPDWERTFVLETDASNGAAGWVLSQDFDDGRHPILFGSKRFNKAERNYSAVEAEAAAILAAVNATAYYLNNGPFSLVTDQRALSYILDPAARPSNAAKSSKLVRWRQTLQGYDYSIEYRPGSANNADALSRLYRLDQDSTDDGPSIDEIENAALSAQLPVADVNTVATDKTAILQRIAEAHAVAHESAARTLARVKAAVGHGWPGLEGEVKAYVEACLTCQQHRKRATLGPAAGQFNVAHAPMDTWAVDFVGPLSRPTDDAKTWVLTVLDHASGYIWAAPTRSASSAFVTKTLTALWAQHGAPQKLISDQGSQFTSRAFSRLCVTHAVEHASTSAYHPQANGRLERAHGPLKASLFAILAETNDSLPSALQQAVWAYNTAPSSIHGETPYLLFYGREAPGQESRPPPVEGETVEARRTRAVTLRAHAAAERVAANSTPRTGLPDEGTSVWLTDHAAPKGRARRKGPYILTRYLSEVNAEIQDATGTTKIVPLVHLTPVVGHPPPTADNLSSRRPPRRKTSDRAPKPATQTATGPALLALPVFEDARPWRPRIVPDQDDAIEELSDSDSEGGSTSSSGEPSGPRVIGDRLDPRTQTRFYTLELPDGTHTDVDSADLRDLYPSLSQEITARNRSVRRAARSTLAP